MATAIETFGSLDILVNNTGINPLFGPLVESDLGAARKIIEVNCIAALSWVQQAYRAWMQEHGGAVLNVGSAAGVQHAAGVGFYGASKAMLTYLTAQLAVELGPDIRVNGIAPAIVKTKFAKPLFEGREDAAAAIYPLKRLGVTEDIGQLRGVPALGRGQLAHRPDLRRRRRRHADGRRLSLRPHPTHPTRSSRMSTAARTHVAIVTGAARGIGAAVAKRLAADGFAVGVLDLDEDSCKETVADIEAAGGRAVGRRRRRRRRAAGLQRRRRASPRPSGRRRSSSTTPA